ncbi:MAG: hypothetical protein LBJ59_10175 [Zoogloeaceae bacterium]|jgi:hypothetical protein|nr:hypothetical protein [Zoogloeaceae bacterium]
MNDFFTVYLLIWASACLLVLGIFVYRFKTCDIVRRGYWRFLFQPWKLVSFALAAAGLIFIAPYTGDMSWDYYDAAFMAVLTFVTAPWVVGVLYKTIKGQRSVWDAYVAFCVWMFSASWSYDLYLLLRDGGYPATWAVNIGASSVLYLAAGLLWNLEYRNDRGVIFAFMETTWPIVPQPAAFWRIAGYALPFMLIAGIAILSFVV